MRTREDILKYGKEYRLSHKEYFKKKNNERQINKREIISEEKKLYYLNNKEKICEKKKMYYSNNKEKINKQSVVHRNNRRSYDTLYKLKTNVRGLIISSIKLRGYKKASKTQNILGCTFEEFKIYLESKFEPWMNWNNYGNWNEDPKEMNTAWDIDHIIPMYEAKTEEETLTLNHYSNLQPLCSYTNRHIKRNKILAA